MVFFRGVKGGELVTEGGRLGGAAGLRVGVLNVSLVCHHDASGVRLSPRARVPGMCVFGCPVCPQASVSPQVSVFVPSHRDVVPPPAPSACHPTAVLKHPCVPTSTSPGRVSLSVRLSSGVRGSPNPRTCPVPVPIKDSRGVGGPEVGGVGGGNTPKDPKAGGTGGRSMTEKSHFNPKMCTGAPAPS